MSTLFLWTALVAVVMGVVRIAPDFGIAFGIFCFLAALHTVGLVAHRKRRTGHALTVEEKIVAFIESSVILFLIAIAVVLAAISALFVICASTDTEISSPAPAFALAAIIAAAAVVCTGVGVFRFIRALWRSKD